jgi:hypothetical protein
MIINITEIKREIIKKKEEFEKENKATPKNLYFHKDFHKIFEMANSFGNGNEYREVKNLLGMEVHAVDNLRYDFTVGE